MTDLARLIKMDQLDFRLKNLEDDRFKAVLQAAAKAFGWNGAKTPGHGYGIAGGFEKGGHVATCAEVLVNEDKEVKVLRVTQAFECGAIVNPHQAGKPDHRRHHSGTRRRTLRKDRFFPRGKYTIKPFYIQGSAL